jgi:hypothetical protein
MISILSVSAFAVDPDGNDPDPLDPEYSRVTMISAGLTISADGEATCSGVVEPTYSTDSVTLIVRLQYWNGTRWVNYCSWQTIGSGIYVALIETQSVTAGYYYRVRISAECVAASGGASETVYANSYIRSYP